MTRPSRVCPTELWCVCSRSTTIRNRTAPIFHITVQIFLPYKYHWLREHTRICSIGGEEEFNIISTIIIRPFIIILLINIMVHSSSNMKKKNLFCEQQTQDQQEGHLFF